MSLGLLAYFRFVDDEPDAFQLLFGSGARRDEEFADAVRRVEANVADAIAPLIAADLDDDHRLVLAYALVAMAEGTSRHWVTGPIHAEPEERAARLAHLPRAGPRGVRR